MSAPGRDRAGSQSGPTFDGLYDPVIDELHKRAEERGVDVEQVEAAHQAVVNGDRYMTSHEDIMEQTGLDFHGARQAAGVLSDLGDLHECYDDDWDLWWVRCDGFIKDKCESRRISLLRYYRMRDELFEFQNHVVDWYVRRNRRMPQEFRLTDKKAETVGVLRGKYFPDKPLKKYISNRHEAPPGKIVRYDDSGLWYEPDDPLEAEWSRHIAARYVLTAQNSIERSFDLTY